MARNSSVLVLGSGDCLFYKIYEHLLLLLLLLFTKLCLTAAEVYQGCEQIVHDCRHLCPVGCLKMQDLATAAQTVGADVANIALLCSVTAVACAIDALGQGDPCMYAMAKGQ